MPLSKRTFLKALTCPTQGWRNDHDARGAITPAIAWRFYEGNEVQRLVRRWLGEGRLLPSGRNQPAVEHTAAAIADPDNTLLFEATFEASGCVARADAIRQVHGGWELLEFKSSTIKPDADPKPDHIDDIGYSCAVAQSAGLVVVRATLVMINAEYLEGAQAEFIASVDVTDICLARAAELTPLLATTAARLEGESPVPQLIYQCRHCEHFEIDCIGAGIPDPLFDLPGLREGRFDKLFPPHDRISTLPNDADLTANQMSYIEVLGSGEVRTDQAVLDRLDELAYPVHYLDFEAIAPAVPRFEGTKPYQTAPFQYSLHIRAGKAGPLTHQEYLAPCDIDWRREFAESLIAALGEVGSVVVYSPYERTVIRQLIAWFPDLESQLAAVSSRLFDLEKVVRKGYLHPGFRGKTSIKKVLPVMAPELDYAGMEVAGGEDAAAVFGFMVIGDYQPESHPKHRANLLEYCKLDTLAMVRVHEELEKARAVD